MFTRGSDEVKKWMLSLQKFSLKERDENLNNTEEDSSEETNPFDTLENLRDTLNSDLKDPDNDEEIHKILKKSAKILKSYLDQLEQEDKEEEEKPEEEETPQQPQQQMQQPIGPQQGLGGIGGNMPSDMEMGVGLDMSPTPPSGGQM